MQPKTAVCRNVCHFKLPM